MITLQALMRMDAAALHAIVARAAPLDPEALVGRQFLGVDLSLPELGRKLLWHTFRKTFHRDPERGVIRGWNVRMRQTGVDGVQEPLVDRQGRPVTFGHYHLRSAEGVRFPRGWSGAHYLDYGVAGNPWWDPAGYGFTPLVAVNKGRSDLLLGWEVFKLGGVFLPLPFYWALRLDGPLDAVVPPPGG